MVEESLIKHFPNKKLSLVQVYLFLIRYEALKTDVFLNNYFDYEEIKLIIREVNMSDSYEDLYNKLERIKIQNDKPIKDNLNSKALIEYFGPFPKEVEDVLRENVIDNMDDLLNSKLIKGNVDSHVKEYIDFMKEWYDFSRFEKEGKQLTKCKKNSKI